MIAIDCAILVFGSMKILLGGGKRFCLKVSLINDEVGEISWKTGKPYNRRKWYGKNLQ